MNFQPADPPARLLTQGPEKMKTPNPPAESEGAAPTGACPDNADAQVAADAHEHGTFDADRYAIGLAELLRRTDLPLSEHRARLAQLSSLGPTGTEATSAELARHILLLGALFERLVHEADEAMRNGRAYAKGADAWERFLDAALRAQRAATSAMGAMKVLRDSAEPARPYRLP